PPDSMIITGAPPLLLSEIALAPNESEMIEIVNPGHDPVALDHYYVSDSGTYWKLPAGAGVVALDTGDFIVRFPAGATIPGHGVITIALDTAANFKTANSGIAPTYSVADGTITVVASSGTPSLTNTGELVALCTWDGASDLVTDVDLMIAGKPSSGNGLVDKSGQAIDGPDADSTPTKYKTDANTLPAQAATVSSGKSTKRLM